MRLHAVVINGVVARLTSDEEQLQRDAGISVQIDVHDWLVKPRVGWILSGNQLVPATVLSEEDKMLLRFEFGNALCDQLIRQLSIKNRLLNKTGAQVLQLITALAPIEQALRKCALPTALYAIQQSQAAFAEYADEFNLAVTSLQQYLENE